MNKTKKILCLLVLFAIAFSGLAITPFITHPNAVAVPTRPNNGGFVVAAASALDAVGAAANNLTPSGHGDDLLAGNYETYTIVVNASDADGAADIDLISVSLVTAAGANVTTFLWTTATGLVTELTGGTLVALGAFTNVTGALDIDITIPFTIEWAMGARTDLDLNITLDEGGTPVATRQVDLNLDVIATLTLSDALLFGFNEYLNEEAFGTMTLTYHYTGYTTLYPLAAQTDFYVSMAAVTTESIGARAWESTSYAQTSGIAAFNDIVAPDTNDIVTLTFTEYAVAQSGGSADTSLMATTNTDTVIINPDAPPASERPTRNIIGSDIFATPEGVMLIGGVAAVIVGGAYMAYGRGSTSTPRRRGSRKRTSKKKSRSRR